MLLNMVHAQDIVLAKGYPAHSASLRNFDLEKSLMKIGSPGYFSPLKYNILHYSYFLKILHYH